MDVRRVDSSLLTDGKLTGQTGHRAKIYSDFRKRAFVVNDPPHPDGRCFDVLRICFSASRTVTGRSSDETNGGPSNRKR